MQVYRLFLRTAFFGSPLLVVFVMVATQVDDLIYTCVQSALFGISAGLLLALFVTRRYYWSLRSGTRIVSALLFVLFLITLLPYAHFGFPGTYWR